MHRLRQKLTPWWAAMAFEIAFLATWALFLLEDWLDEKGGGSDPK